MKQEHGEGRIEEEKGQKQNNVLCLPYILEQLLGRHVSYFTACLLYSLYFLGHFTGRVNSKIIRNHKGGSDRGLFFGNIGFVVRQDSLPQAGFELCSSGMGITYCDMCRP